jgi:hypothetical protein
MHEGDSERPIDKLLWLDAGNCWKIRKDFDDFDPDLMALIHECSELHEAYARAFSAAMDDSLDVAGVDAATRELDPSGTLGAEHLVQLERSTDPIKAAHHDALRFHMLRSGMRRQRMLLLTHVGQLFVSGATDMLRLRLTSALGHMRLQIEGAWLVDLFRREPERGYEWYLIKGDKEGRRFFRETNKDCIEFATRHRLDRMWGHASAGAHHVRFEAVERKLPRPFPEMVSSGQLLMSYQEHLHDPLAFLETVLEMLHTQRLILDAYAEAVPEVQAADLTEGRLGSFGARIHHLSTKLANLRKAAGREVAPRAASNYVPLLLRATPARTTGSSCHAVDIRRG